MGKMSIFQSIRFWLSGVAFRIFLWLIQMTQDEYIDSVIVSESGYLSHITSWDAEDMCTCRPTKESYKSCRLHGDF